MAYTINNGNDFLSRFPSSEITKEVTEETVKFANDFGHYLGTDGPLKKMTTTQLRRFFGEVKRQQLQGYNRAQFVLLKPKLAYAVGRDKGKTKIKDFYSVMSKAIDLVQNEDSFNRFVQVFEAIVAFHKAAEEAGM